MRYNHDPGASSLALESHHQPQLLSIYPPTTITSTAPYTHDASAYYQPNHHVFGTGPIDFRSRLGSKYASPKIATPIPTFNLQKQACRVPFSRRTGLGDPSHVPLASQPANVSISSAPLTGMGHSHTHRNTPLPLPSHHHQISARDQYATHTPSFRRPSEHPSRSPTFSASAALRRNPISPTSGPLAGFTNSAGRMDGSPFNNRGASAQNLPPLLPTQMLGSLSYTNSDGTTTSAKVDISGSIDKGFFLSDGEWTCYRRNYFACVCSYTLTPNHYQGVPLHYTPSDTSQHPFQIFGFAMCISAVVAENDQQGIELVQHTPKRDKGPVAKPEKIPLAPKQTAAGGNHHAMSLYSEVPGVGATSRMYDNFGGSQPPSTQIPQTEHTFERIQFKQATQNNGKRRAAQQYYHLILELWADAGSGRDQYIKVAVRKSAKMIVRGRSPGHYQNDRRGSQSSGPGGSSGTMTGYPLGGIGDFTPGPLLSSGGNAFGGDPRGSLHGVRHHEIPPETLLSSEEEKHIESTKAYSYFPGPAYANGPLDRVEMYSHRSDTDPAITHATTATSGGGGAGGGYKTASETEPKYFPPPLLSTGGRRCGPFEGKPTSHGYYPTPLSPSDTNITMT